MLKYIQITIIFYFLQNLNVYFIIFLIYTYTRYISIYTNTGGKLNVERAKLKIKT